MTEENSEIVSHIWDESRDRIKGFIKNRIDNEADAEDVLQNVFFKIHRKISELKDPDKLYPWIFQMTRHAIIDFYRDRKMQTDSADDFLNELTIEPQEQDIEEAVLGWLEPMIGELPDKYREAVLLTDIKGLTQKQLSAKMDITLSGAKSRVQRGREQLREVLLNCCHLEFNRAGKIVEYRQKAEICGVCPH